MNNLSFDQLPVLISELKTEIVEMKSLLLQRSESQIESNNPINIKQVAELTSLTVPTLYGYCQRKEIPYQKKGNRLYFFKSEVIDWIKTGKSKTKKELIQESDETLSKIKSVEL